MMAVTMIYYLKRLDTVVHRLVVTIYIIELL